MHTLATALRATLVTLVLTGLLYPLAVTGLAQVMFPSRANGSIITDDKGREIGSELIGQGFADAAYVRPRPSASGYDAANSSGTNLSTTSKKLRDGQPDDPATKDTDESFQGVKDLAAAFRADNGLPDGVDVPADAVTRSASGIDPHVFPDTARLQAPRIARARGVSVDRVQAVIAAYTEGRELGFLGEPRVNVLLVNLALDRQFGRPAHAAPGGATMSK
ncbi:MAG TPA: K(+)-transporting ATPase subunit C [Kofleriaceae bacterium]|nr:K(+)-transporting ATPase subunit C [Kofleriaceae bacterium]